MPVMLDPTAIISMVGNGLRVAWQWMSGYQGKPQTEARIMTDENKKVDEFNKDLREDNLEEIRKKLSSSR